MRRVPTTCGATDQAMHAWVINHGTGTGTRSPAFLHHHGATAPSQALPLLPPRVALLLQRAPGKGGKAPPSPPTSARNE